MKLQSDASGELPPQKRISRSAQIEFAIIVLVAAGMIWACWVAWMRMREAGVIGDFSVLFAPTSWDLSSSLLPHHPSYPYWKTLLVAYGNSILVAIPVILFATAIGVVAGVMRVSDNLVLAGLGRCFVDLFRNIPVILQISFWYAVLLTAPRAAGAFTLGDMFFLSNRGLVFPTPSLGFATLVPFLAGIVLIVVAWFLRGRTTSPVKPKHLVLAGVVLVLLALVFSPWEIPERRGFAFRGGGQVSIEYIALLLGLTIYGAAFVAEIVRGSLNSVPVGQIEAAKSLGLKSWDIFWKVKVPLSLRMMILPLSNQYLFLIKGTGLGLAVGFAEAFQVTVTSINQTGKSIDFLVIMMVAFFVINFAVSRTASAYNDKIALKYNGR